MITEGDIDKLLTLARIEVTPEEKKALKSDVERILSYVGDIQDALPQGSEEKVEETTLRNVFREDGGPHASGLHTEKLLALAPERDGDYFVVKKIL